MIVEPRGARQEKGRSVLTYPPRYSMSKGEVMDDLVKSKIRLNCNLVTDIRQVKVEHHNQVVSKLADIFTKPLETEPVFNIQRELGILNISTLALILY